MRPGMIDAGVFLIVAGTFAIGWVAGRARTNALLALALALLGVMAAVVLYAYFVGDGQVRCAGRDDRDQGAAIPSRPEHHDRRSLVPARARDGAATRTRGPSPAGHRTGWAGR